MPPKSLSHLVSRVSRVCAPCARVRKSLTALVSRVSRRVPDTGVSRVPLTGGTQRDAHTRTNPWVGGAPKTESLFSGEYFEPAASPRTPCPPPRPGAVDVPPRPSMAAPLPCPRWGCACQDHAQLGEETRAMSACGAGHAFPDGKAYTLAHESAEPPACGGWVLMGRAAARGTTRQRLAHTWAGRRGGHHVRSHHHEHDRDCFFFLSRNFYSGCELPESGSCSTSAATGTAAFKRPRTTGPSFESTREGDPPRRVFSGSRVAWAVNNRVAA